MEELKLDYYFKNIEEFTFKEVFEGCTYPWEVLNNTKEFINKFMKNKEMKINKATEVGEFCSITGNYFIGEGTKIHSNVTIQGPVLIGKNVEIQSGALIRPGTIIGDGASVGHASEVKHAILQNKSKVASLAFVGDSILGKSARIGSGTILANRRFDQKNITIKIDGQKIDTTSDFFRKHNWRQFKTWCKRSITSRSIYRTIYMDIARTASKRIYTSRKKIIPKNRIYNDR